MATRVSLITLDDESLAVTKTPLSGDRRDRSAEGHWLQRANALLDAQPVAAGDGKERPRAAGVVPLLTIGQTPGRPANAATITTARVTGETLRTTWLAPAGVATALSLVADLLADLHTHGLVHGNLSVDHIILDPDGPKLCSPHGSITDPLADSVALGHCVRSMLERWTRLEVNVANRDDWERLAASLEAESPLPMRRAAQALVRLASPADSSPIEGARSAAGDDSSNPRPWGFVVAGAIGATSLAGLLIVPAMSEASVPNTTTELEVDGHQYQLSAPAGSVTVIDNACDHQPLVVLLDADRDLVWQFGATSNPDTATTRPVPGDQAAGSILAEVPGAEQLAVETGELCPTVWAIGPAGRTLVIGEG